MNTITTAVDHILYIVAVMEMNNRYIHDYMFVCLETNCEANNIQ